MKFIFLVACVIYTSEINNLELSPCSAYKICTFRDVPAYMKNFSNENISIAHKLKNQDGLIILKYYEKSSKEKRKIFIAKKSLYRNNIISSICVEMPSGNNTILSAFVPGMKLIVKKYNNVSFTPIQNTMFSFLSQEIVDFAQKIRLDRDFYINAIEQVIKDYKNETLFLERQENKNPFLFYFPTVDDLSQFFSDFRHLISGNENLRDNDLEKFYNDTIKNFLKRNVKSNCNGNLNNADAISSDDEFDKFLGLLFTDVKNLIYSNDPNLIFECFHQKKRS